jgi:alpha-ketoglutarate-dependent taurine dioxygenase
MRRDHPEHLAVLARNDATFHYRAGSHRLVQRRPMLSSPGCNSVSPTASVFYAPPFQGVLDSVPEDEMEAYYAALQAWDALVAAPALTHRSRLFPGRCVVFDNRRVLHARTAFDPASGPRHLKGSYLRMDDFLDRLRGLEVSLQIGERNALSDDSLHPVV